MAHILNRNNEIRMEAVINKYGSHGEDGEDSEQLLEAAEYFLELRDELMETIASLEQELIEAQGG